MAVNESLAQLSDQLFSASVAAYSLAVVGYCGEYAFGRRRRAAAGIEAAAPAARSSAETTAVAEAGGSSGVATLTKTDSTDDDVTAALLAEQNPERVAADRARTGERFGRLAVAVTVIGLLMQVTSLLTRGLATDRLPWGNMFEFASAIALVTVVTFLMVLRRQPGLRYLGGFALVPVILVLVLSGLNLYAAAGPLVPALRSYWLAIHVTAASIATGIFIVSFVASALYLVRSRYDRKGSALNPTGITARLGRRLPVPDVLDRLAHRTMAFAFPIWTFAVIAGAIWAESAWGRFWGWDPKETWAFISWVVYAAYLHARATAGWKGSKAAWINVLGMVTMVFNFVVVNVFVSGLHSYSGLS